MLFVNVRVGDDVVEVNAAQIATVRPHREGGELTGAAEIRLANGAAVVGHPDFDSLSSLSRPAALESGDAQLGGEASESGVSAD